MRKTLSPTFPDVEIGIQLPSSFKTPNSNDRTISEPSASRRSVNPRTTASISFVGFILYERPSWARPTRPSWPPMETSRSKISATSFADAVGTLVMGNKFLSEAIFAITSYRSEYGVPIAESSGEETTSKIPNANLEVSAFSPPDKAEVTSAMRVRPSPST